MRLHLLGFLVSDIGQHLSQTPFIGIIGVQGRSNAIFTFEGLHILPQQDGLFICHSASGCGDLILNGLEHGGIDRLGEDFIRTLKWVDAVNQVNEAIDPQELMTTNASYMLSEDQIKQIVNALPTQKKPGIGLVIIAKLLNKAEAYGSYQVVFFNTETKEIIQDWATGGKARGFGLRNYWAGSIHKVIRNL